MNLLFEVKNMLSESENFIETTNYYYQTHDCCGADKKVNLDFKLKNEISGEVIRFGKCKDCGAVYFHKTEEWNYR